MKVNDAIEQAEALLPGCASPDGQEDPRWQAIIAIGEFIDTHPHEVWSFIERWGRHRSKDLRMAVATCLLEHLLEDHFDTFFDQVVKCAKSSRRFADTLSSCWRFGQSLEPQNAARLEKLIKETKRNR